MNYSRMNEEQVIRDLFNKYGTANKTLVDIGASDGVTNSNSFGFLKDGWAGVAIEADPVKTPKLRENLAGLPCRIAEARVGPESICGYLEGVPYDFDFLSLDIDGYDYFVLKALLDGGFQPAVVCLEINATIPPPFKFTVLPDPEYRWAVNDFFGQSLSAADELLSAHSYRLHKLCVDNAIFTRFRVDPVGIPEEYRRGFLDVADCGAPLFDCIKSQSRKITGLGPELGMKFIESMWPQYSDKFKVWL